MGTIGEIEWWERIKERDDEVENEMENSYM
jgi:hypothetical protein